MASVNVCLKKFVRNTKKALHTNVAKCWDALRPKSSQAHGSWSELRTSEETYIDFRLESDTSKR